MNRLELQSLHKMSPAQVRSWLAGRNPLVVADLAEVVILLLHRQDYLERLVGANLDRKPVVSLPLPSNDGLNAMSLVEPVHPAREEDHNPCSCSPIVPGVVFLQHSTQPRLYVRRCRECPIFETDEDAAMAASRFFDRQLCMTGEGRYYLDRQRKGGG